MGKYNLNSYIACTGSALAQALLCCAVLCKKEHQIAQIFGQSQYNCAHFWADRVCPFFKAITG